MHYQNQIRSNPKWPITSFAAQVKSDFKVDVSIAKLYRAKYFALDMLNGSLEEQYACLHNYIAELKKTNPGTTVSITGDTSDCTRFGRIYVCLGALKKGFIENCRPLIGLDGCHLSGPSDGLILLSAVGVDGDNNLYHIAYGVVESESKSSWKWFIELLKSDLCIENSHGYTFMSDKQKGLLQMVAELCPNSEHRHCLRHMYKNMSGRFKGLALKDALYDAARATTVPDFDKHMRTLQGLDQSAYAWVLERDPAKWSKAHFQTFCKSDMYLNNLCESFNNMILSARQLGILALLEKVRLILMKRIHVNRTKMLKHQGSICPKIQSLIDQIKDDAAIYAPEWSGGSKFEVLDSKVKHVVDLHDMSCTCRKWDLTGIPCKHGVSAIYYAKLEPERFVHHCYTVQNYLKCYSNLIQCVRGSQFWEKVELAPVLPPIIKKKKPGRKQIKRRLEPNEILQGKNQSSQKLSRKVQNTGLRCGNCLKYGHNRRSCKEPVSVLCFFPGF